jgi:hypothetical protein
MEEVEPSKLIPGEYYYLENKTDKTMRGKGQFLRYYYDPRGGGDQAAFLNVSSINNKPRKINAYSNSVRGFPIASYKFYKPLPEGFIDSYREKDKQLRVEAARRMINSQYPYPEDVISTGNMFSEEPYVTPPTYEQTPQKTNIGNQLANQIGEYLGGKIRQKTRKSRKSRKSRKTKYRRRR